MKMRKSKNLSFIAELGDTTECPEKKKRLLKLPNSGSIAHSEEDAKGQNMLTEQCKKKQQSNFSITPE